MRYTTADAASGNAKLANLRSSQKKAPTLLLALERIAAGDAGNPQFAALAISEARAALDAYKV